MKITFEVIMLSIKHVINKLKGLNYKFKGSEAIQRDKVNKRHIVIKLLLSPNLNLSKKTPIPSKFRKELFSNI